MVDIPAADDPRVLVTITVGLTGGKSLLLRVPRFDYIDEAQHEAMTAALKAIDEQSEDDLPGRKRQRAVSLVMLKPCVTARDYKTCEGLTVGQLVAIRDHWVTQSNIPLGEYLASAESSTANTEALSNTTYSAEDGGDATSDAA